jgi:hypothetical protein
MMPEPPGKEVLNEGKRPPEAAVERLPVSPGLCASCQHASVNATRRGTTYLRCTRASWDPGLPRYPRLPVTDCPGYTQAAS